jgi:hypothetical protein
MVDPVTASIDRAEAGYLYDLFGEYGHCPRAIYPAVAGPQNGKTGGPAGSDPGPGAAARWALDGGGLRSGPNLSPLANFLLINGNTSTSTLRKLSSFYRGLCRAALEQGNNRPHKSYSPVRSTRRLDFDKVLPVE